MNHYSLSQMHLASGPLLVEYSNLGAPYADFSEAATGYRILQPESLRQRI